MVPSKKLLLGLLFAANSLFAITLAEINLQTHPRAMVTQVEVRDGNEFATKINVVNYEYWNAGYPYDNLKYNGKVESWYYTYDFANYYNYSTWWDQLIDQTNLSITYLYIDIAGYSKVNIYKYEGGERKKITPSLIRSYGDIRVYRLEDSSAVRSFFIETEIQATDGTVKLGNNVLIYRDTP